MLRFLAPVLVVGALLPCNAYAAGSDTDSFQVTATVLASCDVVASTLAFGNYDPVAASNLDAETTFSVVCTNGTPYNVGMSLGSGAGAAMSERRMTRSGGTQTLDYTLYQDSNRSILWGNTGTDRLAGTGSGTPATIHLYGRVPMQQASPAGAYSDTIVITVSW